MSTSEDWKTVALQKRQQIHDAIPREWLLTLIPSPEELPDVTGGDYIDKLLTDKEKEITESDAVQIVAMIGDGSWTAVDVTTAFCHRAAIAGQLTNCLHEIFFDAAIADAQKLDDYYAANKKTMGPLHGLPISLKDQFHIRNVDTHMGYVGWINTFRGQPHTAATRVFESEMCRELRALGAVLYVKTAVPHTLMCGETLNNIVGYVTNPKNRLLSSGGSSGGEGALISMRGSPVGFGTDIGGSIRIPSAFCGLYGLRPSSGRLPYEGMANSMDGQNTVLSTVGPLGSSLGALRLVTKAVLAQEPWLHDPTVVEMPWRVEKETLDRQLAFGVIADDGNVVPSPPVKRAIDMVANALKQGGHEVIAWSPPLSTGAVTAVVGKAYLYDGGHDVHTAFALSGEPPISQLGHFGTTESEQAKASDIAANNVAKRDIQKTYMEYWNSTSEKTHTGRPVDAVICPVTPLPSIRKPTGKPRPGYFRYAGWVNGLDYTSVVLPITTVDKAIDVVDKKYKPRDNADDKACYEDYDPEMYHGANVGLQLIGRRFQEEKILAVADVVDRLLKANRST